MSNKVFLIAITATVIAASGIFILAKSRPADIQSNVNTSSASSSLNSVIVKNLQSSSSSSLVVSSSVAVSSVTDTPKVETLPVAESKPVVQAPAYGAPQPVMPQNGKGNEVIKPAQEINNLGTCENLGNVNEFDYIISNNGECFRYSKLLNTVGKNNLNNYDLSFINQNINDIAVYYHNSVRSFFPTNKHYTKSLYVQKLDDKSYIINFSSSYKPLTEGVTEARNIRTYKLIPLNLNDGEFEEVFDYKFPNNIPVEAPNNSNIPNTNFGHD
jgi:hypothetical protein